MDQEQSPDVAQDQPPSPLSTPPDDSLSLSEESQSKILEYINASNSWQFSHSIPNFPLLGDVVDAIIHSRFPSKPRHSFPSGPHFFPLKLCLLGSQFSGRHTNSKVLEAKYGLKVFEIEKILEDRNKVLERKQELEEGKKPKKVQEDESEIFVEEAVNSTGDSAKDKARLLRAKLRGVLGDEPKAEEEQKKGKKEEVKCQGWLVLGFPKTAEEAEELELELAGFVDSRHLPPSTSFLKKQESFVIAQPSGRTVRKPVLEKSVFDLVIKLEVPSHVLVKRAVDRRVDASGNVYNLSFNPPPDNLLPKLKPIENPNEEEILRNFEDYNADKNRLNAWLHKFGVGKWQNFVQINETKLDLVKETIEKKIQEWLKVREENMNKPVSYEVVLEFHDLEVMVYVQDIKLMYNNWIELKNNYIQDLLGVLSAISNIKNDLESARQELFDTFEEFLCRPDHKQDLIDPFIEKLAKLLESKAIISTKSRKNLYDELDNLSDQLWDIIEGRKEENLKFLSKLINQDPCLKLMTSVLASIKSLVSIELSKLVKSLNLIQLFYSILNQNQNFQEIQIQELNIDVNIASPDLGDAKLDEILIKGKEIVKGLSESEGKSEACAVFLARLDEIQNWGKHTLVDIVKSSKDIFKLLDFWVGQAIKAENDAANEIINAWKEAVKDRRVTEAKVLKGNEVIKEYLTRGPGEVDLI